MIHPFHFMDSFPRVFGKHILIAISLQISIVVLCQKTKQPDYNSGLIPDSLKINANAVIREALTEYSYQSAQTNRIRRLYVITVLNKNGDSRSIFNVPFDKFSKIISFRGSIFDEQGKLIRKIKNSEFSDISESAGYPAFDDIIHKYFKPLISTYPYTVEYEYEMEYSGSYYFPDWKAFEGFNVSIEKTDFIIRVPADYQLLYKQVNISGQPEMHSDGKSITYAWNAANINALEYEPFMENIDQYVKSVFTSPSIFILNGHPGRLNTWKDLAEWQGQLNEGRDVLSENTTETIHSLIKNTPDDRSRVKLLYSYLQGRTRYFSIQLGIGGYQPMEARLVDEVGYGDCKGLVNYMKAMLKVAGIESYYCLVKSGTDFPQIDADFPSDPFNHIILCVPLHEDTIWLECTAQTIPFGFLGDFTSDRQVLLVKSHGGELVRTPVYSMKDNFQNTAARVTISQEGNASAEISRKFGSIQFDQNMEYLHSGVDELKKWIYDYIDLPNFKVNRIEFKQADAEKPESVLDMSLNISSYGSISGKRIFLPVNLINRSTYIPPKLKKRWSDIKKVLSYIDSDSIEYLLPEGFEIEFIPEKTEISSPFGCYQSHVTRGENKITYIRQLKMFKGHYPKDSYDAFMKFYNDINRADRVQAILAKK